MVNPPMLRQVRILSTLLRNTGGSIQMLNTVLILLTVVYSVAIGSEVETEIDAEGWPLRYPVVRCGQESTTVFVEADRERVLEIKSNHTKGAVISHGKRRFIYSIVDMQNGANPQSQTDTDQIMDQIEAYWERMSHGRLDIELTAAGRVSIPFSNASNCRLQDWTIAVDDRVGSLFDLYQYDVRVYFFPGQGACSSGGQGTTSGNPEFPIYTGGFANQTWVLIPFAEFIVAHEIGHNFGLGHGTTPGGSGHPMNPYGDRSTIMGDYNFYLSPYLRELRGLHGVNRHWLGWLDPVLEMKTATYTLYASELAQAPGPQLLSIPHPWSGQSYIPDGFFLSYRVGSDGVMADGSFAPLLGEYTRGVGLRFTELLRPNWTSLYRVLEDGEYFEFTDPEHENHTFFTVHQISHDHEKVTFELEFVPRPSEESIAAGTCSNGIDDDGDSRMDFGGGTDWVAGRILYPEGVTCMITWESIAAPAVASIGSEFFVVCESEIGHASGIGPVGNGYIETINPSPGRFIGRFKAAVCGEHMYTCGALYSNAFIRDHLETTIEVLCPPGMFCEQGSCRRFPGHPNSAEVD